MRALSLLVVATSLSLSACSSLTVQVDVLNPAYVNQQADDERLRKTALRIMADAPGIYRERVQKQVSDYQTKALQLVDDYQKAADAKKSINAEAVANVWREELTSPSKGIQMTSSRLADQLESVAQSVRSQSVDLKWTGGGTIPEQIKLSVQEFQTIQKSLQYAIQTDLDGLLQNMLDATQKEGKPTPVNAKTPDTKTQSPPVTAGDSPMPSASETEAARAVSRRSIIQDGSLASTDFAYIVANAPKENWAQKFNRAYGGGYFGSSDIVIRLNSTADFSVKGLLFDGSKVAQVASKVLAQTMMIGAQIAGVPVTRVSTGTSTGADALSQASADLSAVDAAIEKREAIADAQHNAIRSAARTILGVAPLLTMAPLKIADSNNKDRLAAHDAIDNSISALAELIKAQNLE